MTADLRENCHFGAFHIFTYFSPKWANILWNAQNTFQVSCGQLVVVFIILKGFLESWKNWRFSPPRPCVKNVILEISENVKCPSISQTCIFLIQMGQIFTFQVSWGQLVVVFISFKDFPESRKNWSFSWPRTCERIVILGHFTFSLISHPNEQIFTFQVSCGQLVVVFIILKGFLESWKNWRFSPPRPCVKNVILGISQTCIFLIQMGKYLPFKCPGVNWWWFSSVLKTFQKVEKIEVFHDRGPARKLSFWGISHFHLFLTQMSKYLLFKCPVVNWWLFSSF